MRSLSGSSRRARITLKKVFGNYYTELCSPGIADPTDTYAALVEYLRSRQADSGSGLPASNLEQELNDIVGEIAQDIGSRKELFWGQGVADELAERFWECARTALRIVRVEPFSRTQ